jgi:hypothetical protein
MSAAAAVAIVGTTVVVARIIVRSMVVTAVFSINK